MKQMKYFLFSMMYLVFLFAKYGDMDALEQMKTDTQAMVEDTSDKTKIFIQAQAATKDTGEVLRVVDGDTYVIAIDGQGVTVRLIGIDTPESVCYSGELVNTEYGKKASEYAKELLPEGTKVWLQYDKETEDDYGRTLAYVYTKNADGEVYMVNEKLVTEGYARAVCYRPNDKYRRKFKTCHLQAKENGMGFWSWQGDAEDSFEAAFPGKDETEY